MQTTEVPEVTEVGTETLPALPTDATVLFKDPVAMEAHLDAYRALVNGSHFDVSTATGRGQAKSLAYAISQAKVEMDDFGKSMTEDAKRAIAGIDTERRKMRETMDELRDAAKAAAVAWEVAEQDRKASLEARMRAFHHLGSGGSAADLRAEMDRVSEIEIDETWQERQDDAAETKALALGRLADLVAAAEKHEADQAELAALRAAAAERLEREKAEAEEKAKRDAEEAVARERERVAKAEETRRQAEATLLAQKKRRAKIKDDIKAVVVPMIGKAKSRDELGDMIAETLMEGRMPWVKISL